MPSPIPTVKASLTRPGASSGCRRTSCVKPVSPKRVDVPERLIPAQLFEALVVDPEMMGYLVQHGPPDLVFEVVSAQTHLQVRNAVDHDAIGKGTPVVTRALEQGHPLI